MESVVRMVVRIKIQMMIQRLSKMMGNEVSMANKLRLWRRVPPQEDNTIAMVLKEFKIKYGVDDCETSLKTVEVIN